MIHLQQQLQYRGILQNKLPMAGGAYVPVNVRNSTAYVSIQFPILNGTYLYTGELGTDLSTEDGIKAAELCAANILLQLDAHVGLHQITGLNHLDIYLVSNPEFEQGPKVADGASRLLNDVLGERGQHTRGIAYVQRLPAQFSIGIVASFSLKQL